MPTQQQVDYLTKADAARWYRRSERSLSRDITNAIKAADQDVLKHVRLRLENGTLRSGDEIAIDEIIRLRDDGQNPTWELEVSWLELRYGKRGDTSHREDESTGPPPAGLGNKPATMEPPEQTHHLPAEPQSRLAVLEAVNTELRTRNDEKDAQIRRLEQELDCRAEERREENELQKQNNVLMQQIYNLLEQMQPRLDRPLALDSPRSSSTPSVDADIVRPGEEGELTAKPVKPLPKRSTTKTRRSRRTTKSKKRTTPVTAKESTPSKPADSWLDRHLPTVSRLLPSRQKR